MNAEIYKEKRRNSKTLHCYFRVWEQLLKISGNDVCCDCGGSNPRWASINLGITLCIGKFHSHEI